MQEGKKDLITSKGGQYEILRKLGEGYTGEVYLVKDMNREGEPVALKLLNPEAFKEGQLEAFKREFMLLSDLHHPYVCRVYDFGFSDNKDRYFFTQELIQGTDLYTYTEKLSVEEIEEIFVQITDALGFIHAAGLIHFDIKGDNILMTSSGEQSLAKIVDFGLAAPSFETPENIAGTVRYISPEMITKTQGIDYRADLYSLGIVLYRMLARDYPPQGNTMKDVLQWHVNHDAIEVEPLRKRNVPEYLIEVIEKLTRPIPTERFSSASVIIKFIELHSGKTYTTTQKKLVATLMEEGPLVARDPIVFKIRSVLHRLSEKKPLTDDDHQTLILSGPSGSGKSRILKEAKYITQLTELDTYIVRGENEGQDIELFKKAVGLEGVQESDLEDELLKKQPFCMMVDNLDRCNRQVKEIITGFANTLYSSRFLGDPNLVYLIATMSVEGPEDQLPVALHLDVDIEYLKPFTTEDITQYIRLSLGESDPPVNQVKDILNFSGGIPELVKEAIAALDSPTARLSGDAHQLFIGRIEKLNDGAKQLLGYFALAGKPLTQQQLIVFAGLTVETALSELIKDGLVSVDRDTDRYQIATGAVSLAGIKVLSDEQKKTIGSKLLQHFEKEESQDVDAIVRYALIGADPGKVADYLIRAGEAKEERHELDDAFQYYRQTIDNLSDDDERLPTMHRKLARQFILNANYDDALKHLEEAARVTEETIEDLTSKSWASRLQHQPEEALKYILKAIELTDKDNKNSTYIRLRNEEAQCYIQMGKVEEATQKFEETHRIVQEEYSDEDKRKIANNNLGLAFAQQGKYEEAIAFYREKYEFFSEDKHLAASILSQLGYVYQQTGLLDEGLEACKKSWELYNSIGDTHSSMAILGNMISICQSKALFTDALEYVKESIRLASHAGSEKDLAGNFLTLGTLYINLGLEDVARRYLNEAATVFQRLGDHHMEAWAQISFAYLYKNLGRYKEGLAYLENVVRLGEEMERSDLILWGSYGAADMLLDLGRVEDAEAYLQKISMQWPEGENVSETDIKLELLRSKLSVIKEIQPSEAIGKRLVELVGHAEKQDLRELVGEIYHNLGEYYQKLGDQMESAKYVAKAKEIIDDISGTLSEEYRESFLRQQFRQKVFEDSVRLKDYISQIDIKVDNEIEQLPDTGKASIPAKKKVKEGTVNLPQGAEGATGDTAVFSGEYQIPTEAQLVGQSEAVLKIKELVDQVKDSHMPILITGEVGTGREHVARIIFSSGIYHERLWKKVDVSSVTEEFLEHTLWGGEQEGAFETTHDGILFLADVDKMSANLQKKLLKVLEDKKFVSLLDKKGRSLDVRLIVSTTWKMDDLVKEGKMNKNLVKYFTEVVIDIPPLRERKADIPLLTDHFLSKIAIENKVDNYSITPKALKMLMQHAWPKNIIELEQVLRSVCVLAKDGNITDEHISVYI